jgi:hypothetical protein
MNASLRRIAVSLVIVGCGFVAMLPAADAQVVYYGAMRPVVAAPMVAAPVVAAPAYVSNYVPAGNYAAVTAFSPPVVEGVPVVAGYAPALAPVVATVPSSSMAVTSYYAPQMPIAAAPVTTYYAPTAVASAAIPVTAYYAPAAVVAPVVAPVAAYYPPAVVARRGLFGATRYSYYPGAWYTPY